MGCVRNPLSTIGGVQAAILPARFTDHGLKVVLIACGIGMVIFCDYNVDEAGLYEYTLFLTQLVNLTRDVCENREVQRTTLD